ncbi:MAG: transposase [Thermosipho sp. (in: Bacteria)]|nr:transposase [Thermosipho sp. (in: thermotogales)]MCD6104983.1 transposase [Thermosipho sp. (in: thermotogales)]
MSGKHRKGIEAAVKRLFLGYSWKMCYVHFVRNVLIQQNAGKE